MKKINSIFNARLRFRGFIVCVLWIATDILIYLEDQAYMEPPSKLTTACICAASLESIIFLVKLARRYKNS